MAAIKTRKTRSLSNQTAEPEAAGEGADEAGGGELPRGHAEDVGGRRGFRSANLRDRGRREERGAEQDEGGNAEVGGGAGAGSLGRTTVNPARCWSAAADRWDSLANRVRASCSSWFKTRSSMPKTVAHSRK